jgi:ubiquinone/menaquinone biosynthesis C-methylase UbiE
VRHGTPKKLAPGRHHHHGAARTPAKLAAHIRRDLAAFIRRQMDPARARWQKPDAVVRALGLRRGQVVAEIGAGPGYFTPRLARAVGPSGHVYAVEPEAAVLELLRRTLDRARVANVTPVLSRADDPLLPAGRCALALIVNSYHHFPDGPALLRRIARALGRGGRIVNIDFDKRETPVGPPLEHRVAREDFLRAARRAGLAPVAEHRFLPYQYFLVLRPRPGRRRLSRARRSGA